MLGRCDERDADRFAASFLGHEAVTRWLGALPMNPGLTRAPRWLSQAVDGALHWRAITEIVRHATPGRLVLFAGDSDHLGLLLASGRSVVCLLAPPG